MKTLKVLSALLCYPQPEMQAALGKLPGITEAQARAWSQQGHYTFAKGHGIFETAEGGEAVALEHERAGVLLEQGRDPGPAQRHVIDPLGEEVLGKAERLMPREFVPNRAQGLRACVRPDQRWRSKKQMLRNRTKSMR